MLDGNLPAFPLADALRCLPTLLSVPHASRELVNSSYFASHASDCRHSISQMCCGGLHPQLEAMLVIQMVLCPHRHRRIDHLRRNTLLVLLFTLYLLVFLTFTSLPPR